MDGRVEGVLNANLLVIVGGTLVLVKLVAGMTVE